MRKRLWILAIAATVTMMSCRKEADYIPYPGENSKLAYNTYTEQFEYIWKVMSTGYVFWDVDTVDWDDAYERFLPKFEALDKQYADSGYVRTSKLNELYTALMGKMRDHHMTVIIKNLHPEPTETSTNAVVRPGVAEVSGRDYYIESRGAEQNNLILFHNSLGNHYTVSEQQTASAMIKELGNATVRYFYCLITLDDGRKVPYLWQSMAAITPVMRDMEGSAAQLLVDRWLRVITETPRSELAGFILDNRANSGGYQDDLDYLVGTFLNERTEIMKTRYKEGPGRLEYSAWCPYYLSPNREYHRDITAEGIPYVVLCDINSVSMGEIEPMVVRAVLPTSHIVGERTYGGTGPLQTDAVDLNYGGPFGRNGEYNHYVYTSTFEAQMGGEVREGIGLVPDEQVLRKDHNGDFLPQLDAALKYISRQ